MIKKFMIIIILTLFMVSAVSASDIEELVNVENDEIQIQEFAEVDQLDFEECEMDDVVENDVVSEVEFAPNNDQEYIDSYIINDPKNFNEIENHQYNNTYIETLINQTLTNNTNFDLNNPIVSYHIFNDFPNEYEVFICMNIDSSHKTIGSASILSGFDGIDKFKILTHDDLIFYNHYFHILTHDVEKNIIIIDNDKLHNKFVFSIDNSIAGSADSFIYDILNPNFSNFYLFSMFSFQTFSNFVQIFININYHEYSFFPSKTIE